MDANNFTENQDRMGWTKVLLYQLVDNVKDYAIYCSDLDGLIVSWNVGAEKIFGYSANEAIGQHGRILFTPDDQANGEAEKELETARKEGCAEDERWHVRKDDSFFFASGVQTPLYDHNDKHTGYAKIARDLTERIEIQYELQALKDNLEVQVRERTSELSESNESLRLEVGARTQSEKLRSSLLRKIVKTQEDERKRIARDLHDHIGQSMTGLQLKLQILLDKFEKDAGLADEITQIKSIANQIDSEIDFMTWELRPAVLDDLGLYAAMKQFVEDWSKQFGIAAEFEEVGLDGKQLPPEIEINLYRICQEALNNISKHAKATNVSAILERRDGKVSLIIEDDGIGFDLSKRAKLTEDDRGMGLLGMKERAELVGGTIEIESTPGNGTTVFVRVPAQFLEEEELGE